MHKRGTFAGGACYHQGQDLKQFIRDRDNYTCQICGEYGDQVDHIAPWRVSHDSTITNLRVLCLKCNLTTRRERIDAAPDYDEFIAEIELELYAKGLRPTLKYQLS